jgi:FeS assembly SUF system protein
MTRNSDHNLSESLDKSEQSGRPISEPLKSGQEKMDFLEGFLRPHEDSDQDQGEGEEKGLEFKIVDALQTIYDPEIPVNIYELGLIYGVEVADGGNIRVVMTLTTPHCPVAETMPELVKKTAEDVEGVNSVIVDLVWEPPWDPSMMSEAAQLELGFL